VATAKENLGKFYCAKNEYAKAEIEFKDAINIKRKTLGKTHPSLSVTLDRLVSLYSKKGDKQNAIETLRELAEVLRVNLGENHPDCVKANDALKDFMGSSKLPTYPSTKGLGIHIDTGRPAIRVHSVTPQWREILRKANISRRDLKDPQLTSVILDLIEQTVRTGRPPRSDRIAPQCVTVGQSNAAPPGRVPSPRVFNRIQFFARNALNLIATAAKGRSWLSASRKHIPSDRPADGIDPNTSSANLDYYFEDTNDGFLDDELDKLLSKNGLRLSVSIEDELILPDIEELSDAARERLANKLAASMKRLRETSRAFSEPVDDWDEDF